MRISDLNDYDFVVRNPNNGQPYVEYGRLCIDISPDTQGQTGQKSIDWLGDTHELQLYQFDEDGHEISSEVPTHFDEPKSILSDDCEFVIRKGGAGGEIDYTTVKLRQAQLSTDTQGHPT